MPDIRPPVLQGRDVGRTRGVVQGIALHFNAVPRADTRVFNQRRNIADLVLRQIQLVQLGQTGQGRDIDNLIFAQVKPCQLGQTDYGRDIRDPVPPQPQLG